MLMKIWFLRFVDGHQIDTDNELKDDVLFTNDSFGSYLSFPRQGADDVFKKHILNILAKQQLPNKEKEVRAPKELNNPPSIKKNTLYL